MDNHFSAKNGYDSSLPSSSFSKHDGASPYFPGYYSGDDQVGIGFNKRRQEEHQQQREEQQFNPVSELFFKVEQGGAETAPLLQQYQHVRNRLDANEIDNHILAHVKSEDVVRYCQFFTLVLGAYAFSVLLVYAGVAYLVGILVGSNQVLKTLGILVVPIALVGVQLAIGVELHRTDVKQDAQVTPKLAMLKQAAKVLVMVTPAIVLGTFLAETWGEFPLLPDLLLLTVRMLLAFITDVCLVHSGGWALEAISWLVFSLNQWRLKRHLHRVQTALETRTADLVEQFHRYQQAATDFHHQFPDSHRTSPEFSLRTRWVLEGLLGPHFDQI